MKILASEQIKVGDSFKMNGELVKITREITSNKISIKEIRRLFNKKWLQNLEYAVKKKNPFYEGFRTDIQYFSSLRIYVIYIFASHWISSEKELKTVCWQRSLLGDLETTPSLLFIQDRLESDILFDVTYGTPGNCKYA